MSSKPNKRGKVYLVGAGPGDCGLITVRGHSLLKQADCVIYDRLVNPMLLCDAKPAAEIICVAKRVGEQPVIQQQINELLLDRVKRYDCVVRLKGGDPCVFGRGGEEAKLLADAGVEFEIVPGVTAAIAAADYNGLILTDRRYSSQVVFVTGRQAAEKDADIDWAWLAKFDGTIVLYMAVGQIATICGQLIEHGMSSEMPAAVIENATLPTQRLLTATVGSLPVQSREKDIQAPSVFIIGQSAQSDSQLNWFIRKPLFGKTILATRDMAGCRDLAEQVFDRGGHCLMLPVIRLEPMTSHQPFIQCLKNLPHYDWVMFTSPNGVNLFFEAIDVLGGDARVLGSCKVAAIGRMTSRRLTQYGIRADFVPGVFTSRQMGMEFIKYETIKGKKILLLRSAQADHTLADILTQAGAHPLQVALYRVADVSCDCSELLDSLKNQAVDWLTFASPSSVKSFFAQVPKKAVCDSSARIVSIGPTTSEALDEIDLRVDVEAREHTISGMLDAIEGFCP